MKSPKSRTVVPEESLAGRLAVLAAAAVSNLSLALIAGAPATAVVCLAIVAAGHYRSWRGRAQPRRKRGQILVFLLLLGCLIYLGLDLGLALFGGALPQAKFAVMAQAVTSFDLKTRRNLFTHLWHSLVILYIAALFAWSPAFLLPVLLWLGCMWAFLAFTRGPSVSVRKLPDMTRRPALIARWGIAWVLLSGLVFLALPRFSGRPVAVPFLLAVPLEGGLPGEVLPAVLPLIGTSNAGGEGSSINLRVRGRLGDEVAFRVRAPAASYWRAYVLDRYDGQSWRSDRKASPLRPIETAIVLPDENPDGGENLPQTFYIQQTLGNAVLASYPIRELYFPARKLTLFDTGTVQAPGALRRGTTYAVISRVRDLSPHVLRLASEVDPEKYRAYLEVPDGMPLRIKQLADGLAGGQATEYEKVTAIAEYLRTHYRYSLNTPRLPSGADAVDQFLFVDKVGFCEQFASALTILLREEGIPARLAVGYSTGESNPLAGSFTVRARDAHAWVEVLFPGIGWVPVDASPGFDGLPVAHRPARWMLSDLNLSLHLLGGASLPDAGAGLGALGLAVLGLGLFAFVRRQRQALPRQVRTYMVAQKWLWVGGLPVRAATQTPAEHLALVSRSSQEVASALAPISKSVELAVYGRPGRVHKAALGRLASASVRHRVFRIGREA